MSGQADWEQRRIGDGAAGMNVYIHKPCGALIAVDGTTAHEPVCPALTAKA